MRPRKWGWRGEAPHPAHAVSVHDVQKLLAGALREEALESRVSVQLDHERGDLADDDAEDDHVEQKEQREEHLQHHSAEIIRLSRQISEKSTCSTTAAGESPVETRLLGTCMGAFRA